MGKEQQNHLDYYCFIEDYAHARSAHSAPNKTKFDGGMNERKSDNPRSRHTSYTHRQALRCQRRTNYSINGTIHYSLVLRSILLFLLFLPSISPYHLECLCLAATAAAVTTTAVRFSRFCFSLATSTYRHVSLRLHTHTGFRSLHETVAFIYHCFRQIWYFCSRRTLRIDVRPLTHPGLIDVFLRFACPSPL